MSNSPCSNMHPKCTKAGFLNDCDAWPGCGDATVSCQAKSYMTQLETLDAEAFDRVSCSVEIMLCKDLLPQDMCMCHSGGETSYLCASRCRSVFSPRNQFYFRLHPCWLLFWHFYLTMRTIPNTITVGS